MLIISSLFLQGVPSQKIKKSKVQKNDLIEKYYKVVPIHKRTDLLDETIRLINGFWEKTRAERLSILGTSKDDLPMSLIVTFKKQDPNNKKKENLIMNDIFFNRQNADAPPICSETGKQINVLGHLRLVKVPADKYSCFVESMIVHPDFRGKGIGTFFLRQTQKFCEEVLHLKSIYLSTYDSGEFYMKIGFYLTPAVCVYGNGEVNNVSKKIYLKKDLNYVECENVDGDGEEQKEVYDPTKDYSYQQQKQLECDILINNLPFKIDQAKSFVHRLCIMLEFPFDQIKYFYSYELFNKEKDKRTFHIMISCVCVEAKNVMLQKLKDYGVMCFQNFFDKPVNEWDNTLITHDIRYTNLNYVILKELKKLMVDRWIADFKFENHQFHAMQNEEWIVVRNLGVVEQLKTPELPDVPDEEINMWNDEEEEKDCVDVLEKMKQSFKSKEDDESWLHALRRPSEIRLEPLYEKTPITAKKFEQVAIATTSNATTSINNSQSITNSTSCKAALKLESINNNDSWVDKIRCSNDAMLMGFMLSEF
jgi:predicted N-acetyltransferase YhbS